MKRKITFLLIVIILLSFVIIYFANHIEVTNNNSDNKLKEYITYSVDNIQNDLSKAYEINDVGRDIITTTSRGLFKKDKDGSIVPDIAKDYQINENGIEYVISIDDKACWSDGTPITANDYMMFLRSLIKSEDDKNIQSLLDVYGISEYKHNNEKFENTGIFVKDNKLVFRLNKTNDNFIDELTKIQYRLRKSLELWQNIYNNYNKIIYSGDYYIDCINENESVFIKNTNNQSIRDTNKIKFIKDQNSESGMAQFEIGKRDIVKVPPRDYLATLNDKGELQSALSNNTFLIEFTNIKDDNKPSREIIYKDFYLATKEYNEINMYYIEPSEGAYSLEQKNDTKKIQDRKVKINSVKDKLDQDTIKIALEDTVGNRYFADYYIEYFKDNYDIELIYTFINSEDFKGDYNKDNYEAIMYRNNKILNLVDEEELFNKCLMRSLFFYKTNIAKSKNLNNLKIDWYGNLDFSEISY